MQQVCFKRGLDIPINGEAQRVVSSVGGTSLYSIDPYQFVGIVPKMLVKEGEKVQIGSPLFRDKAFENLRVTSPVSGTVLKVERGERRRVLSVQIESDGTGGYIDFKEKVDRVSVGEDVRSLLMESGLWVYLRQRPYDCVALPNKQPGAIFISTFDTAPLAPDYGFLLKGEGANLQRAVDMLGKIAPVYVGLRSVENVSEFASLQHCTLYSVCGPHPAGNISFQINRIRPMAKGETVWTINVYDLALIGKFFATGRVDMRRTVALTGPLVYNPQYYKVVPGMRVSEITDCNIHKCASVLIAGSPISGRQAGVQDTVSYTMNQLSVIDEGVDKHEFMGWIMPRFSSFNVHCTDPAKFFDCKLMRCLFGKRNYEWDARLKGGLRPIIVSNEYDKVFPMDIYPEFLIKAMIAGNIDKMEQLGACEVAAEDFALCEYVCTSKLPLQAIVRRALDNMRKEIE